METLSNSTYRMYDSNPKIRFILRDGEKVLQYSRNFVQYKNGNPVYPGTEWEDVKIEDNEQEK
jgi:hypothetical protein